MSEEDFETWKNVTEGTVVLAMLQPGGLIKHHQVGGGMKVQISKADRRRNQIEVAKEAYDPFLNGMLINSLQVMETQEDVDKALEPNPNHLTDTDLVELLNGNGNTFNKRVKELDSEVVLQRLFDIATDDHEVPDSRTEKLRDRLGELGISVPTKVKTISAAPSE